MSEITLFIERELPCLRCCYPLNEARPECPECQGEGTSWVELEVLAAYDYHRASRGARDRYGAPLEPDEDASVEIDPHVESERGPFELTEREIEKAEEEAMEDTEDQRVAALEARAEARSGW